MADRPADDSTTTAAAAAPSLRAGLVDALVAIRDDALEDGVARGRRHAAVRAYDDGTVHHEIADRLLAFSATA
jgi:hypothetical protein